LFGGLLFLILLGFVGFQLLVRYRERQYQQERAFRRGPSAAFATTSGGGVSSLRPVGAQEKRGKLLAGVLAGAGRESRTSYSSSTGPLSGHGSGSSSRGGIPLNVGAGYSNHAMNVGMVGTSTTPPPQGSGSYHPSAPGRNAGPPPIAYSWLARGGGSAGGGNYIDPRQSLDFLSVRS
jgi:hypothetical protein